MRHRGHDSVNLQYGDGGAQPRGVHARVVRGTLRSPVAFLARVTRGQREVAEDILQETMLRAWRHLDTLMLEPATLRSWLFTVAKRIAIDGARARKCRPQEVSAYDVTDIPSTDRQVEQFIDAHFVREALGALRPAHRAVLN